MTLTDLFENLSAVGYHGEVKMKTTSMTVPYYELLEDQSTPRNIPKELTILNGLIHEAWILVHRLSAAGLRFAGTMEQATLTVAGSAYAAWRLKMDDDDTAYPEHELGPTDMTAGFAEGIAYALVHATGVPAMYIDTYPLATEKLRSMLDHEMPLEVMAEFWPDRYSPDGLRLSPPVFVNLSDVPTSITAQLYDPRPNPLTTSVEDLRRANKQRAKWFSRKINRERASKPRLAAVSR